MCGNSYLKATTASQLTTRQAAQATCPEGLKLQPPPISSPNSQAREPWVEQVTESLQALLRRSLPRMVCTRIETTSLSKVWIMRHHRMAVGQTSHLQLKDQPSIHLRWWFSQICPSTMPLQGEAPMGKQAEAQIKSRGREVVLLTPPQLLTLSRSKGLLHEITWHHHRTPT